MDNENIFIEANKALADGNYEAFLDYCSEDIKWERVGDRTFDGKAALINYLSTAYDGLIFTTENYIKAEDFLVELGQIVNEKDGVTKKSSYCDVWKFKQGLISEFTSFVISKA